MKYGHTNFGGDWVWQCMPTTPTWFVFDQAGLEAGAIPADVTSDPVADGYAYKADTLADLAKQMDVPADELEKTVDLWNQFCESGEDLSFYRPNDTLTPVAAGPFYAQLCAPTFLNT